jgi:hypothetical protein
MERSTRVVVDYYNKLASSEPTNNSVMLLLLLSSWYVIRFSRPMTHTSVQPLDLTHHNHPLSINEQNQINKCSSCVDRSIFLFTTQQINFTSSLASLRFWSRRSSNPFSFWICANCKLWLYIPWQTEWDFFLVRTKRELLNKPIQIQHV